MNDFTEKFCIPTGDEQVKINCHYNTDEIRYMTRNNSWYTAYFILKAGNELLLLI